MEVVVEMVVATRAGRLEFHPGPEMAVACLMAGLVAQEDRQQGGFGVALHPGGGRERSQPREHARLFTVAGGVPWQVAGIDAYHMRLASARAGNFERKAP